MAAFAIGGNQLYATTSSEWQSATQGFSTNIYLLRRPFGMPWEDMEQGSAVWPADSDEPSPVMVTFLLVFTCTTIWVMSNLYKAVIIIEFGTVVREYNDKQPGDLKDDPWPSFSPFALLRRQQQRYKDYRYQRRMRFIREREFRGQLEA